MSWTVTVMVTGESRNYLISKSFGITRSCGTALLSTRSTCACAGPCSSAPASSSSACGVPAAITSTDPSRRLRANPRNPRRSASRNTNQRNPTPWTRPYTRNRSATMPGGPPSPLPPLCRAPPVPPGVRDRDERQDRHHDEHRPSRVAPCFLVQHLEDHVFPAPDEPADPREDRAPYEGSEPREQDEPARFHPGDTGRDRDQVAHDGQHPPHEDTDLTVRGKVAFRAIEPLLGDQHVLPQAQKERAAQPAGEPAVGERAEDAPEHAARQCDREVHLAFGDEVARRRHDELAGQRQNRRLHRHEDHDPGVAEVAEPIE